VNEKEAAVVRQIYSLYRKHKSLLTLVKEVSRRRITTKVWRSKRGREHTGTPFRKVTLRRLLTNAIYVGRIEFKGVMYPGEHEGIVEPRIWEEVNAYLRSPDGGRERPYQRQSAMLTGILKCGSCQKPMTPTYTVKGTRRYRYYVCRGANEAGWEACSTKSISASLIENAVVAQLRTSLEDNDIRETLKVSLVEWLKFQSGEIDSLVRAIVENVTFDGVRGDVSLSFREFRSEEAEAAC
jgi:site-specific DNA recombinase